MMESWANGQPGNAKMACLPKSITSIGKPRDQCDKEKAVSVETILEILRENPKGLSHAKLAHAVADSGVSTHGMSRGLTLRLQLAQAFAASRGRGPARVSAWELSGEQPRGGLRAASASVESSQPRNREQLRLDSVPRAKKPGARLVKLALFLTVVSLGAVLLLTGCLFLAVIEVHAVSSGKIRTSQINGFSWV